ncbi:MAG: YabP/YqfC family sporulation protein [Clostridia bacterium]|nr:YabP/YqfC family sporulation protein [Clostridia bacterium]
MEKSSTNPELSKSTENLTLTNRKNLKLEGINEIVSTSETFLSVKLKDTILCISGQNISITKLDVNTGILEADGIFESIKYGKQGNFLKRIFK